MGDSILRNLDAIGRAYKNKSSEVDRTLGVDGIELTAGHLLRLQFQLLDQSVLVDMVSKVVSKGVQEVDQLTKLQ